MKILNRPTKNGDTPLTIKTETTNLVVELQTEDGTIISTHTVNQVSIKEQD